MHGMCLTARNGLNGTPITSEPCQGTTTSVPASQLFERRAADGGLHLFVGVNKCVDDQGGQGNNLDPIIVWDCNGLPGQRWYLDAYLRYYNGKNANRCLDIKGGDHSAGAPTVLYDCGLGTNQSWWHETLFPVAPCTSVYNASCATSRLANKYVLSALYALGGAPVARCLDTQTSTPGYYAALVSYTCHGGTSQLFTIPGDGTVRLYGGCLDGVRGLNQPVIFNTCNGSATQYWDTNNLPGVDQLNNMNNNHVRGGQIKNRGNNLCVDIQGGNLSDNTPVLNYYCATGTVRSWNQMFGAGTAGTSFYGTALIIERNDPPFNVGHTAWAFKLPDGRWLGGAWDGITPAITSGGTVPKGDYNGHWKRVFMTKGDVLNFFRNQYTEQYGFDYGMRYTWYKELPAPAANTAAVFSMESQSWDWGYGVLGNNCLDQAYKLFVSYGVQNLPWPSATWFPNLWFHLVPGTEYAL
jgi:hypothetical protein